MKRGIWPILLIGAVVVVLVWLRGKPLLEAQVVDVINGDTIEILLADGTREKVRYIGVDTPETRHPRKGLECFGKEATAFNKSLVLGKRVWLELDAQERDRYGRLLAYVWLDPQKQRMANALLLAEGYAQISTIPPNVKYAELFQKLQREATSNHKGLWGSCPR